VPDYVEGPVDNTPLLEALDLAAEKGDGGAAFVALCRRLADRDLSEPWLSDLEQVLWLLDDGLNDSDESFWSVLVEAAATQWRASRAPRGEGPGAYASRWRGFLAEE